MPYIIVGLGNPGEEYENTRHNTGRIILEIFRRKNDFSDWVADKKSKALISEDKIGKEKVILMEPETFMNNSGKSAGSVVKTKKSAEHLVVVHDDLDIPLGSIKISFNRGSGGHNGVESIKKAVKTEAFIRLRIGISSSTPSGKIKKPKGDKAVQDFILGKFKPKEMEILKKTGKRASEALAMIVAEGREKAMGAFN
ncbi:MAG: aminoacyl-tRNA hydrolase [Candidatus Paceibacterota bacterium]|jgi:PTH1 family peptidyl-tRNA hydrolase